MSWPAVSRKKVSAELCKRDNSIRTAVTTGLTARGKLAAFHFRRCSGSSPKGPSGSETRVRYRLERFHGQRGFTMAEQLAVVAVAITTAAAVIPATVRTISGHQFKSDAHSITNYLSLAKMRSAAGFTRSRLFVDL